MNKSDKLIGDLRFIIPKSGIRRGGECADGTPNKDYMDPIDLSNLEDLDPEKRITINGQCYNVYSIYRWLIKRNQPRDPNRILVNLNDIQRLITQYRDVLEKKVRNIPNQELVTFKNADIGIFESWFDQNDTQRKEVTELKQELNNVRAFLETFNNGKNGNLSVYENTSYVDHFYILLAAVTKDGYALQYASEDLKKNREIVLTAVKQNGMALKYASEDLKKDREIVLAAVTKNGYALQYASEDLQKNREIVLTAVKQNGMALQYASEDLKNNPELKEKMDDYMNIRFSKLR